MKTKRLKNPALIFILFQFKWQWHVRYATCAASANSQHTSCRLMCQSSLLVCSSVCLFKCKTNLNTRMEMQYSICNKYPISHMFKLKLKNFGFTSQTTNFKTKLSLEPNWVYSKLVACHKRQTEVMLQSVNN